MKKSLSQEVQELLWLLFIHVAQDPWHGSHFKEDRGSEFVSI